MSDVNKRWDMGSAVSGVTWDLFTHLKQESLPDRADLQRWQATLASASTAQGALLASCEDLVEFGATAERLEALRRALATANGQHQYIARRDRW
jgi:hypothetical protein